MCHSTDMQVSFPAAGQSVLTVSGLNKLDELRNEQRSQVFENMTDSAIARQVVAPLDLDLRTDPSAEAREEEHEFVFQHNQYDLLRSEEHTSELQSLMRISYAVFCLKKKINKIKNKIEYTKRHNNNQNTKE